MSNQNKPWTYKEEITMKGNIVEGNKKLHGPHLDLTSKTRVIMNDPLKPSIIKPKYTVLVLNWEDFQHFIEYMNYLDYKVPQKYIDRFSVFRKRFHVSKCYRKATNQTTPDLTTILLKSI